MNLNVRDITAYTKAVYAAEQAVLSQVTDRMLNKDTAMHFIERLTKSKIVLATIPEEYTCKGYVGLAHVEHATSKVTLLFPDLHNISDLTLCHEIGHALADPRSGHDLGWMQGYLKALRIMHRGDVANRMRRCVGPVLVDGKRHVDSQWA
jgi:hypothetical protein